VSEEVRRAVADAHRREWAFVLAATARVAGDFDLAEECVQDAYVAALDAWVRQGVPANPAAWLTTTARRKALDVHRRDRTLRNKLPLLIEPQPDEPPDDEDEPVIPDDRLRLIFTCCHPALAREAQVALTLRLVCGLTTGEIAQAFLVSEATMAARVTRAKKKISVARISYRVPEAAELPDRLDAVLTVVHLLFTTGHTAPAGAELVRADLIERAVGLGRLLLRLMPDEREVRGLLALMLLTDARRDTRVDATGRLLLLDEQDRSRWDAAAIDEGVALVVDAMRGGQPGRFTLQAAIAALHDQAPRHEDTGWAEIQALYRVLERMTGNPMVTLNRAAAAAMADGPAAGLAILDTVAGQLGDHHRYLSVRAHLLEQAGDRDGARAGFQAAAARAGNVREQQYLITKAAQVAADSGPG